MGMKLDKLHDVSIVDLLGRTQIDIETERIQSLVNGKTVLITGAGGSIGSELSRQICSFKPQKLFIGSL